ncbi:MAG: CopD family protein [Nitrospirae bacterium]|nr:CopD family protein [Nitrospirota bacterium]
MTHSHLFLHIVIRWLDFTALAAVLGGLSYRCFVLTPACRARSIWNGGTSDRALMAVMLAALVVTSVIDLSLRTVMMSGRPVSELFSVIPTVFLKTHFGGIWIGRFGLILLLGGILFLEARGIFGKTASGYLSLGAGAALGLTTGLSGHAANQGNWTGTVFVDWVHVLAVSGWVGGLFILTMHLSPFLIAVSGIERRAFLAAVIRSFSTVAMTCVGGLLLSGAYNTWIHVHSTSLLVGTEYGKILILKWALLVPMILLGGISRFYVLPRLENSDGSPKNGVLTRLARSIIEAVWKRPDDQRLERLFVRLIIIEAVLGLGVLGCSAWITQLPPPHETSLGLDHGQGQHTM